MVRRPSWTEIRPNAGKTSDQSGIGQNSCTADKQACMFGSFESNKQSHKHSVSDNPVINGLNFQTV